MNLCFPFFVEDKDKKEKTVVTAEEDIQVVDKDGNDIEYEKLNSEDKQIVLTELLLQTALQSIAEKRIVNNLLLLWWLRNELMCFVVFRKEAMGNLVKNSKKKEEDGQVNDVKVILLNDLYSGLLYSCLIESD